MTNKEKKAIFDKLAKIDKELTAVVEALPHEHVVHTYGSICVSVDESVLRELTDDIQEEPWEKEGYATLTHRVGKHISLTAIHSPKEVCPF